MAIRDFNFFETAHCSSHSQWLHVHEVNFARQNAPMAAAYAQQNTTPLMLGTVVSSQYGTGTILPYIENMGEDFVGSLKLGTVTKIPDPHTPCHCHDCTLRRAVDVDQVIKLFLQILAQHGIKPPAGHPMAAEKKPFPKPEEIKQPVATPWRLSDIPMGGDVAPWA